MPGLRTNRKPEQRAVTVLATADVDAVREEELNGINHLVVPIVALVEGVIQGANAGSPELARADEFGAFPEGWNGRPVTLGHPKVNGAFVSANSPKVLEDFAFGFLFNTRVEDGKLKTEAWINLERVEKLGGDFQTAVDRLQSGEMVEVSTGLFTKVSPAQGRFNGEAYVGIWTNVVPDHLAILAEGVLGACSVEDGCGAPRLNQTSEWITCNCKDPSSCKCNKSPDEPQVNEDDMTLFRRLRKIFGIDGLIRPHVSDSISDIDTRRALSAALGEEERDFFFIVAVFTDRFVYEVGFDDGLLQRGYSITDGQVTLANEVVKVRPETRFIPLETQQETTMANQKVDKLIANEQTKFTEEDRVWLETLSDTQLDRLEPVTSAAGSEGGSETRENAESKKPSGKKPSVNTETEDDDDDDDGGEKDPVTLEGFLKQAPPEVRETLQQSVRMHNTRKEEVITALSGNKNCQFSKDELKAMSLENLEKLAVLSRTQVSYEGRGSAPNVNRRDDDDKPDAPLLVFPVAVEKKKA